MLYPDCLEVEHILPDMVVSMHDVVRMDLVFAVPKAVIGSTFTLDSRSVRTVQLPLVAALRHDNRGAI